MRASNGRAMRWWVVPATFVLAFVLNAMWIPDGLQPWRPDWVSLVLIYWCLALPNRVGVGTGWTVGLVLDITNYAVLGQNALAMAVMAYLANHFSFRVRMFPLWQQALAVLLLLGVDAVLVALIQDITGAVVASTPRWWPVFTGTLLWPLLYLVLRDARRRGNLQ